MISVPSGWSTRSIGDVTGKPQKREPIDTGRDWVRYVDIGLLDGPEPYLAVAPEVSSAQAPSRCRQVIAAGDTLFSTVRPYLRKIALVASDLHGEFASTGYAVLRPTQAIHPAFLYYFTLSNHFEEQIFPLQKGVSYPAVLDKEVRAQRVWLPEMIEQRRIVEILEDHLSRLDAAERELQRAKAKVARLWSAALSQARVGDEVPLPSVTDVQGGIQKQPRRAPAVNHYAFLRVANVTAEGLDLRDIHRIELFGNELQRLSLRWGDLLVVEGNGSASQIGRAALWDGSIEDCVHQNHLIRVRPNRCLLPAFLEAVWNSPEHRRDLSAIASSSSGLHTLSVGKLKQLRIPVPDLERQAEVVEKLGEVRAGRRRTLEAIALAEAQGELLRRAVLAAAFEGKLTGRHTDQEVIEEAAASAASA